MAKETIDLNVRINNLCFDTPIIPASGVFGYGDELIDIIDYKFLGAIVTKTLTWKETVGNPPPRIWELENGLINSIGLQNIGVKRFCEEKLPRLNKIKKPIIVSVGGEQLEDMEKSVEFLNGYPSIAAFELNLSCPNTKTKQIISENPDAVYKTVKTIKRLTDKPVITKLSPNVTDICEIGKSAEEAGADMLCAGNTFKGLYYNWHSEKFYAGGVSGGMIFPMACRNIFELYRTISIPIIGLGGINSEKRAIEMVFAGASIVGVGTHLVITPDIAKRIYRFFIAYLKKCGKSRFSSIVGIKNGEKYKKQK